MPYNMISSCLSDRLFLIQIKICFSRSFFLHFLGWGWYYQ